MAAVPSLSVEERAEVGRRIAAGGLLAGIAFVREITRATLAEAVAVAREIGLELGVVRAPSVGPQLGGEVFAIGPFSRAIVPYLPYDEARYEGVADGSPVLAEILGVYRDTDETFTLAASFGIDPWDFNAHALDPARVDLDALGTLDVLARETFVALRDAGFHFYFCGPSIDDA